MGRSRVLWAGLLLMGVGSLLIAMAWSGQERFFIGSGTTPPEPIVPTRTPTAPPRGEGLSVSSSPSREPTVPKATETTAVTARGETEPSPETGTPSKVAPSSSRTASRAASEVEQSPLYRGRPRWGVSLSIGPISRYDVEPLRLGWYLDWGARAHPAGPEGAEYAQMVRLKGGMLEPDRQVIAEIAQASPGSLWLIGNEPDVKWQDNVEPAVYARLYHEAYSAIKGADPTAEVAVGGVTQPTPLRLQYLEQVLAAYEEQFGAEIPVDMWNVHSFILREERDGWGVGIPPGLPDERGVLYEIDDGDNMQVFRQQIVDFRRWMAEHGYRDRPLIVSEYGILMPEEYGFPAGRVVAFMTGTFDFFLTASDPALGYAEDDYRLVQRWCWYSLNAPESGYPTGRLMDPETGGMTAVGEGWEAYVERVVREGGG